MKKVMKIQVTSKFRIIKRILLAQGIEGLIKGTIQNTIPERLNLFAGLTPSYLSRKGSKIKVHKMERNIEMMV